MKLILIQGASATGKTTLAHRLTKDLGYPMFLKDAYKENRYDQLGGKPSIAQWIEIEHDSRRLLNDKIAEVVRADGTLIIEANFKPKQREEIKELLRPDSNVVEVYCYAKGWKSFKRFVRRNLSGERHKGHLDYLWYIFVFWETLIAQIGIQTYKPLRLSPNVIKVNTTDFNHFDYNRILDYLSKHT